MEITAQDILNIFNNPNDIVNLRIFEDKGSGIFSGQKISVETGKFATKEKELKTHNDRNRGIFYVVNTGGDSDKDIKRINAQFVEMDAGTFDEQQAKVDAFKLPPTLIIKTQKSLHVYWKIKDGDVDKFRGIQKQLVAQFAGDPMCINESRCMRLPGFYHCKKDPVMVECISFHPERIYTQTQLADVLPEIEDDSGKTVAQGTQKGLHILESECEFIKYCHDNAATLSEHDWYAMITNMAGFEGGAAKIHDYSKGYPGYDQTKTQKKINHFLESKTGPITCQVIADKGYQCPKLQSGACSCKSPAAITYKPLEHKTLKSILDAIAVSGDAFEDVKGARQYITDYLYNVDAVLGETFIKYTVKEHFGFKEYDLKPLIALYKDLLKAFLERQEVKKAKSGMEIPDWYVVTKTGLSYKPGILADHLKGDEKVFYAAEQYFMYEKGVYGTMNELTARNMVRTHMLSSECKLSQITDTEGQWKMQVQEDFKNLNANPFIINVQNGLYNVLDDKLTDHTPDYLSTVQIGAKYEPSSVCPRFIQYLNESLEKDQIPLVQEMLGYFLVPTNRAQKAFLIVGVGGSGKSVLLRTISDVLLGRDNVSNVSWQALNERFKPAELFGKLVNAFADLPTKNIDDNGIFKALVGEDYLTVEYKNKKPFSFQSFARLLFSCNNIPKNYGDRSDGFYRRLIIIKFNHAVPQDKKDPELLEKFKGEADGILLFAIEGLKRLLHNNFIFSETQANKDALQQYREESNSCIGFVNECCEVENEAVIGCTMLYEAYKIFCEDNGMKPYGKQTFNKELESNFDSLERSRDTTGNKRIWKGIKLLDCLD